MIINIIIKVEKVLTINSKISSTFLQKLPFRFFSDCYRTRKAERKKWSQQQLKFILYCYWLGDGSNSGDGKKFSSTSKSLIFDINTIFNAMRIISPITFFLGKKKDWKNCWQINLYLFTQNFNNSNE